MTDHIRPHKGDGRLFWDEGNHQSLCASCHNGKTAREDGGFGAAVFYPEWLERVPCNVVLVCGAPASGKSTHVRAMQEHRDIVIDLDLIVVQLYQINPYTRTRVQLMAAIDERNKQLASLAAQPRHRTAWVVVTGAGRRRLWWREKMGLTRCHVMATEETECMRRIRSDEARASAMKEQLRAVRAWYAGEGLLTDEERAYDEYVTH